jgi:hypothetical protein
MMAQVYTKITLAATGGNPVDRLLAAGLIFPIKKLV